MRAAAKRADTLTELVLVPGRDFSRVWPLVRPAIEQMASKSNGHYALLDITSALIEGAMQLWIAMDGREVLGFGVSELRTFPTGKRALCWIGAVAKHRHRWLTALLTAERWAREQGCTEMQAFCRPGKAWARILAPIGYSEDHVLLTKALT